MLFNRGKSLIKVISSAKELIDSIETFQNTLNPIAHTYDYEYEMSKCMKKSILIIKMIVEMKYKFENEIKRMENILDPDSDNYHEIEEKISIIQEQISIIDNEFLDKLCKDEPLYDKIFFLRSLKDDILKRQKYFDMTKIEDTEKYLNSLKSILDIENNILRERENLENEIEQIKEKQKILNLSDERGMEEYMEYEEKTVNLKWKILIIEQLSGKSSWDEYIDNQISNIEDMLEIFREAQVESNSIEKDESDVDVIEIKLNLKNKSANIELSNTEQETFQNNPKMIIAENKIIQKVDNNDENKEEKYAGRYTIW